MWNQADVNITDNAGETPLLLAVKSGNFSKRNKSRKNVDSFKFLFFIGRNDMAKFLIGWGANVNLGDKDGSTPLHLAAEKGYS